MKLIPTPSPNANAVANVALTTPIISDSLMNKRRISLLLSPKARKIPISFVRELTDINIVTIIINADTSNEIAAIADNTIVAKLT